MKEEESAVLRPPAEAAARAMQAVLEGRRPRLRSFFLFACPAVIASVGYMDPGNFATNIQAGAH